jgi:hypothetical protein
MTHQTFKTPPLPTDQGGAPPLPSGGNTVTLFQLDPDEYREHLAEFDMSREQQDELLGVLWNIMRTFVEIGFGLDSVQMFSGVPDEKTGPDSGNTLGMKDSTHQFNQVATRDTIKEEHDD